MTVVGVDRVHPPISLEIPRGTLLRLVCILCVLFVKLWVNPHRIPIGGALWPKQVEGKMCAWCANQGLDARHSHLVPKGWGRSRPPSQGGGVNRGVGNSSCLRKERFGGRKQPSEPAEVGYVVFLYPGRQWACAAYPRSQAEFENSDESTW